MSFDNFNALNQEPRFPLPHDFKVIMEIEFSEIPALRAALKQEGQSIPKSTIVHLNHPNLEQLIVGLTSIESLFQEGLISGYGVTSDGFSQDPHGPVNEEGFLSVGMIDDWIEDTGAQGFKSISTVYNLLEPGAVLLGNQEGHSLVEACEKRGWELHFERIFNAKLGAHWIKFTDFESDPDLDSTEELKMALGAALAHEGKYKRKEPRLNQIGWAHLIRHNFQEFSRPEVWSRVRDLDLKAKTIPFLNGLVAENSEYSTWASEYLPLLEKLSLHFTEFTLAQGAHRARRLAAFFDSRSEKLSGTPLLSQKTIRILGSALNGKHCTFHIEFQKPYQISEVLAALSPEPLERDEAIQIFESLENFSM